MTLEKIYSALTDHVPAPAVDYCFRLWREHSFEFHLRKTRITKIGDFTFRTGKVPRITVNSDLHPYLFLITYVHEVAHLVVHREFGNRIDGHGAEWKNTFREMLLPVLSESNFPEDVLTELRRHMIDPLATTYSDPSLMRVLRKHDPKTNEQLLLADIPEGSVFGIRGRWFKKGQTKRTRALCQELRSKRKYFVPVDAPVENVQLALL